LGRPKSPEEQQLRAHVLHEQGFTPKAIKQELEQEFEKPVSLRTVERWRSDFKSNRFQVKVPKGLALKDRCDLGDHTWMMDRKYEAMAYTREDASEVTSNLMNIRSKRTCLFCKKEEITRP